MRKIIDFEIHSKYSRACSPLLDLKNIGEWANRKGVDVIGTGDFTHPKWLAEIKRDLKEVGNGLLKLKDDPKSPYFILSAEISSIYSHNGKTRRIHNIVLAPSIEVVEKIIAELEKRGAKLASDGRPIVGIPSKELLKIVLSASEKCMLIPAHVWTPYFGLFGSMSGYDSVEECFEEMSEHIYALETGLSADPEMFWRISKFDKYTLVSCSDPHSLPRIGRECNVFDMDEDEVSYDEITRILKTGDRKKFKYTLEYYPEEGRYHYDGHADCDVSLHPKQTAKLPKNAKGQALCPKCGTPLTIGVLSRAEQLADRTEGYAPKNVVISKHFVVLEEIIAAGFGKGVASKKVQDEYIRMTNKAKEIDILLELSETDLGKITGEETVAAIMKMRSGKLDIVPGYDGKYGKVSLFEDKIKKKKQAPTLFD